MTARANLTGEAPPGRDQRVYAGEDGLARLGDLLGGGGDTLFVAGTDTYPACGIAAAVEAAASVGRELRRFSEFSPNPQHEELLRLHEFVRGPGLSSFGAILAVGGGTAIDLAKLIKAFARGPAPASDGYGSPPPAAVWEVPLIALPTTAGSGSEATSFAVIYSGGTKYSVEHPALRPEVCLLVPQVLRSLPPEVAAASGLDALCQGIESYWSVGSTPATREIAAGAIALAWENLASFVHRRGDAACAAMSEAAHLAGRAINETKTTAAHAVSYPMTARFGVPHGLAVALASAAMFPFNAGVTDADVLDPRGADHVRARLGELYHLLGVADAGGARKAILQMVASLGVHASLAELGITGAAAIETIVENGFNPGRVTNNPRRLTPEALAELLRTEADAK